MNINNNIVKVENIMTKKAVALHPDDSIEKATHLFEEYNYDGFPVVNSDGQLVGIVTAYDMVRQSYSSHLPSLVSILESIYREKTDEQHLIDQFKKAKSVKIKDMMNIDPLVISPEVRVEDLAKEFIEHHRVNPIPVIDPNKKLLGLVSRFDVLRFFDEKYLNKILQESGHGGILKRLDRL